jgi:hypothetical protein
VTQHVLIQGNSAGPMNGDGSRKALLHSTEGSSIEGAVSAYRQHNSWPTKTVDLKRRIVAQHLDLNVAARSLQNLPGGADATNKDGDVLIQYELVGSAKDPASIGSRADWEWFGREVLGPDCRRMGIPLVSTVCWVAYPASFGNAPQRLSPAAWDAYSGVLGHQHAPDNVHGDPGAIDIKTILSAARGDDFMSALSDAEQRELLAKVRAIAGEDPVEDSDIASGTVRANFKTLIQGSVLDGLRERDDDHPDRGALRPVFLDLIREALAPPPEVPDAPASP